MNTRVGRVLFLHRKRVRGMTKSFAQGIAWCTCGVYSWENCSFNSCSASSTTYSKIRDYCYDEDAAAAAAAFVAKSRRCRGTFPEV